MNSEHKDFQKEYDVKWVPYWEEYKSKVNKMDKYELKNYIKNIEDTIHEKSTSIHALWDSGAVFHENYRSLGSELIRLESESYIARTKLTEILELENEQLNERINIQLEKLGLLKNQNIELQKYITPCLMETAPKDGTEILAWCDDKEFSKLDGDTSSHPYQIHKIDLGGLLPNFYIIKWVEGESDYMEFSDKWVKSPDWWFFNQDDYEIPVYPIFWLSIPLHDIKIKYKDK